MVVGEKEGLRGVARLLGNNAKQLSDTDFFSYCHGYRAGRVVWQTESFFPRRAFFLSGIDGRRVDGGIGAECRR